MRSLLLILAISTLSLGCDGAEPETGGNPCPGTGSLSATIDGDPVVWSCVGGFGSSSNVVITGREAASVNALTIQLSASPVTAGQTVSLFGPAGQVRYAGNDSDDSETAEAIGGEMTVASVSSGGASGTFAFEAFVDGRTVRVTGGAFTIAF